MRESITAALQGSDEVSLLGVVNSLLRRRRLIVAVALVGAVLGLGSGLLSHRLYMSTAVFLPQDANTGSTSGLAAMAGQFGLRLPSGGSQWDASMYLEIITSPAVLAPITADSVLVPELNAKPMPLMAVLNIQAPSPEMRVAAAIRALQSMITTRQLDGLSAVEVDVESRWPSLSQALALQLLQGVNRFNLETRNSQAKAERRFAEAQASAAGLALREAEDNLQAFLEHNRVIQGSPQLQMEQDRLQRLVSMRQSLYTSLLQAAQEARLREVRNTPVITVIQSPRAPVVPQARRTMLRTLLGAFTGAALGILIALLQSYASHMREAPNDQWREFVQLLRETSPRLFARAAATTRGGSSNGGGGAP